MNGWSAELAAAQSAPSPRWSAALRVAARSTAWHSGGDAWQEVAAFPAGLAAWPNQSIANDAANGTTGILRVFLSWWQGALACQYVPAALLGESASWTSPSLTTVATFTATGDLYTPKPAVIFENGRWHLFYRLPAGNICHRSSSNNGATWSGAVTVFTGANVAGDLFALYLAPSNLHLLQFSTMTDVWRPAGASRLGHTGSWNLWSLHASAAGWLPAGLVATGALSVDEILYAREEEPFRHLTARSGATLNSDGTPASRDAAPQTLWSVIGDGAVRPRKIAAGRGFGGPLVTLHDAGAGRAYPCAAGLPLATRRPEEPLLLSDAAIGTAPLEGFFAALDGGLESWVVGLTRVFRSLHRWEDVSVGEEDLIAWRFVSDWASGGRLDLRLRPGSAAAVVQPGDGLWLTRSAWIGEPPAGGGVTLGLRVERVERSAAGTRVVARDALGILATTFARRPFQIDPARFTLEGAVDALICWAGLRPVRAVTMAGAPPLFQWQGGESGLAALRRLLRGQAVILRARVAAPGDPPTICVCAPEGATSATYGAYGAAGVQPIVQRVRVEDSSPPRLAVVQGALTRFAPAAGEEWALAHLSGATTGPSPAVRARPLYLLNRNLEGAEQSAIAGALRCALEGRQTRDLLIAQPHVALELDDRISVEGVESLVARIDERWERGRFVQRLDLGG